MKRYDSDKIKYNLLLLFVNKSKLRNDQLIALQKSDLNEAEFKDTYSKGI